MIIVYSGMYQNAIFASRKLTNLSKDSAWKAKGNSTFYNKYRTCRLTYQEAEHKMIQPCNPEHGFVRYCADSRESRESRVVTQAKELDAIVRIKNA